VADTRLIRRLGAPIAADQPLTTDRSERVQLFEHGLVTVRAGAAQAWIPAPAVAGPGRIPLTDGKGYGWALSPDGRLAAVSSGASVELFQVSDGEQVTSVLGRLAFLRCLAFSRDGGLLAASGGRRIWLWNPASGDERDYLVTGDDGVVQALAFAADGRLAAATNLAPGAGSDASSIVRVYDSESGRQVSEPIVSRNAGVPRSPSPPTERWPSA
jgi:WD40 repeat protein